MVCKTSYDPTIQISTFFAENIYVDFKGTVSRHVNTKVKHIF